MTYAAVRNKLVRKVGGGELLEGYLCLQTIGSNPDNLLESLYVTPHSFSDG